MTFQNYSFHIFIYLISVVDGRSKVLLGNGPVRTPFGGGNMSLDGNDATKTGRGTCGFLAAGGGDVGA